MQPLYLTTIVQVKQPCVIFWYWIFDYVTLNSWWCKILTLLLSLCPGKKMHLIYEPVLQSYFKGVVDKIIDMVDVLNAHIRTQGGQLP